jgi:group I intron endonuclease
MISGIYKITNIRNNKCYIGSTINIIGRWAQHKKSLSDNKHHSIKLQRSYNKYDKNSFKYEIIEKCSENLLIIREQYFIDLFDSYRNGYNSTPFAGNNLGMKHSDETKEKLRKSSMGNKNRLGKTFTEDIKRQISEKLKGKPLSEETKKKMSESQTGRIMSEETKLKLHNANIGKVLSDEHKYKLAQSHLGKKQKSETIEKRVKLNTGKKRTEESKRKISDKLKGIKRGPMSDEQKLVRSKRIALLSQNGDIIKEFDSVKDCAKYINSDPKRISEVITGKKPHHKKYKFRILDKT